MFAPILEEQKQKFDKVMEALHEDLLGVRTGRANPALLGSVMVEAYGTNQPLVSLASVNVSDSKTLQITPWDKSLLASIEKGILSANLGLTPNSDGNTLRMNIPQPTEQRRQELAKLASQMGEKARIAIRNIREDGHKQIKKMENAGGISQDQIESALAELQELVDRYNEQIKITVADKEQEIMKV